MERAREKCNLEPYYSREPLFRCVFLSFSHDPSIFADLLSRLDRSRHGYPGVNCTQRQFNRWKSPIIADDPPIYDLTSYVPTIPAFELHGSSAARRAAKNFGRGCISREDFAARNHFATVWPGPVRIMIIIFPREDEILPR